MMRTLAPRPTRSQGFSLIELLVVISVIGLIAAIAIPAFSNLLEQSRISKAQRNAQEIASLASNAIAAGFSGSGWTDLTAVVQAITGDGVTVDTVRGAGAPMSFRLPNLSTYEKAAAANYLVFSGSTEISATTVPNDPNFEADYAAYLAGGGSSGLLVSGTTL